MARSGLSSAAWTSLVGVVGVLVAVVSSAALQPNYNNRPRASNFRAFTNATVNRSQIAGIGLNASSLVLHRHLLTAPPPPTVPCQKASICACNPNATPSSTTKTQAQCPTNCWLTWCTIPTNGVGKRKSGGGFTKVTGNGVDNCGLQSSLQLGNKTAT
ncbi:hypothetical protein WJX73_003726 [Symbiochloris irregularis]|uniref:Uncharacterized protein n=1 Tax=Symbiochloris irregularis TaxID=706552 RepID=A0AAW1P1K7_9CHLO